MAGFAAGRYAELEPDRQPYLDRARNCSKLTIPSLMPDSGANASTSFSTPFQSLGARGLNNISSKLLLSLFPSNVMIFTLSLDEMTLEEVTGQEGMEAEVNLALNAYVKRTMAAIDEDASRTTLFEALKHGVNSGNALVHFPDEGGHRVFRLDSYVVKRDPTGRVLEIITKETVTWQSLSDELKALLPNVPQASTDAPSGVEPPPSAEAQKPLELFTHIYLSGERYHIYQEIEEVIVPGSVGNYLPENLPFIPIRFIKVDGEDYGRGYIEEYLGDLNTLEGLYKSVTEFAAIASQVKMLVNPAGLTSAQQLRDSPNGAIMPGRVSDISVVQVEKGSDFRATMELIDRIEARLAHAFLLNTAIQRPGERVTAEEIRYMARELDDALGGIYAIQSQELQLPVIKIKIAQLNRQGSLPKLPPSVTPKVVAGMDALGRSQDLSNLDAFVGGALQMAPDMIGQHINWSDYLGRRAAALGIDIAGLIKTPEQLQAEQQQAQMMMLAEKLGPNAVNQMGQAAQQQMEQQ